MRKYISMLSLCASALFAQSVTLDPVNVQDSIEDENFQPPSIQTIYADTIQSRTGSGSTNPYKALDMLPSVYTAQSDSFGLTTDDNPMRVRGMLASTFNNFALTLEDIPSVVIVQKGVMGNIVDMENIASMDLYYGASPANKGLGFGNSTGSLNMSLKKAANQQETLFKQSFGNDDFSRTFFRIDSGNTAFLDTKFFLSASHSEADKWKGYGETKRNNVEFGMTSSLGNQSTFELFTAFNDVDKHDYLPMTYAQLSNLDGNYDTDFSNDPTSKYYYQYNFQNFTGYLIQPVFKSVLLGGKVSLKPYFIATEGDKYSYSTSGNLVTKTEIEQKQYGIVAEYEKKWLDSDFTLGFWYQSINSSPPPFIQKTYKITKGQLVINNASNAYSMLNDIDDRESYSPYISVIKQLGELKLNGGLRYIDFHLPEIQGYTLAYTAGDLSYDDAISKATIDPRMHVDPKHFRQWMPTLSLEYPILANVDLYMTYAKGIASPDQGPLWSIYKSNQPLFASKGISLQNFWDRAKYEVSDHYNLGLKIDRDSWHIEPKLFYVTYKDKQVTAYDPLVKLSYKQSIAEALSTGAELSISYTPDESLEVFSSVSYTKAEFSENLLTSGSSSLYVKGNQLPDAPKVMLKAGGLYKYSDFYVMPSIRYIGERFGEAENKEKVSSHTLVDCTFGYDKKFTSSLIREVSASLSFQNIFDKKYIALIQASDDTTATTGTGAQYVPGAPFSTIASLSLKF